MDMPIAFISSEEVVVNFGILTGREATIAEIDRLARALAPVAGPELEIASYRRHAYGPGVETVVHQVAVAPFQAGAEEVLEHCEAWALDCAADRRLEPLGD